MCSAISRGAERPVGVPNLGILLLLSWNSYRFLMSSVALNVSKETLAGLSIVPQKQLARSQVFKGHLSIFSVPYSLSRFTLIINFQVSLVGVFVGLSVSTSNPLDPHLRDVGIRWWPVGRCSDDTDRALAHGVSVLAVKAQEIAHPFCRVSLE